MAKSSQRILEIGVPLSHHGLRDSLFHQHHHLFGCWLLQSLQICKNLITFGGSLGWKGRNLTNVGRSRYVYTTHTIHLYPQLLSDFSPVSCFPTWAPKKKKKRLAVPAFSQRQVTAKGRGSEVCNVLDPGSRNLTFSICRPNVVHLHGGEICDTQFFPTGPFGRLQNPQAHHWGVKEYFNAYYIELHLCPRKCCPVRNMGAWLGIVNLSPGLFPH